MHRVVSVFVGFIIALGVALPNAWATQWNQETRITINEPLEIPHQILPAGSYWFVLDDNGTDREVVQVYSDDWSKLYATLLTIPKYRQHSTDHTEIRLAERPANKPEALLTWYYPGKHTGHEFVYSARHEKEFAHDGSQTMIVRRSRNGS